MHRAGLIAAAQRAERLGPLHRPAAKKEMFQFLRSSSKGRRRRSHEAPCGSPAPPSHEQDGAAGVCVRQNEEALPPWTPRSVLEAAPPPPVAVPDDALSSAEPSPARPSPAKRDERDGFSARKLGPLPWEARSVEDDPVLVDAADGSELPSPAPSPLGGGVASKPSAKVCPVCGSLYAAAVCRCSVLSFNHPIVHIVAQTTPGRSPTPDPEVAARAPEAASRRDDRVQRSLWGCTSPGSHAGSDDLVVHVSVALSPTSSDAGRSKEDDLVSA